MPISEMTGILQIIARFPNRSATLCGDSQAVKTMKNTAEVCHAAGGAKPPKSWLLHKG